MEANTPNAVWKSADRGRNRDGMKPSLPAHISNLCRELVQARNDLTEFKARAHEMIAVLEEHIHLLHLLDRRSASKQSTYVESHGRENTIH